MPLSWNEIKTRALAFSKEWENTQREEAEAKEFLIEDCFSKNSSIKKSHSSKK